MKKKLSVAMSLAMILAIAVHSLALAAVQPAYVSFTADAPCAVTVLVTAYTNPANQPGQSASGSTSWTLDTYPSTSVTFFYPLFVVCSGVTYNFISISPGSPLTSGSPNSTTRITGHYVMDTTPPALHLPADMTVEATGASGAVVTFMATADDTNPAYPAVSCVPASGSTFGFGATMVNCSATDAAGNTANDSFTVTVQDTTPPTLNLPVDRAVTAADASGAVVNFSASANDLVDGSVLVTCLPASGSTFPIGSTIVNCSAADSHGNTAGGSFTVAVQYAITDMCGGGIPNRQILQPINADGSSVFKRGSTVPARFRVCGPNGVSIGSPDFIASFRLVQIVGQGVVSNVDQAVISTTPDTSFRFGNRQWIFNISTKNLTAGNTYVYLISLKDGSFIQFQFSLK